MKIYSNSMFGRGTMFVTPGKDHPETSNWMQQSVDGENRPVSIPTQYAVKFNNGEAEVDDQLGKYMIAKGLATPWKQRIILPASERFDGRPQYARPIEVGRSLRTDGASA